MIRQKTRIFAALLVVMALLLSGCASKNEPAPVSPPAAPSSSAKAPAPESVEKELPPPAQPEPEKAAAKDKDKGKGKGLLDAKLNFTDIKSRKYSEQDIRGKVVLLVYWATWCPP